MGEDQTLSPLMTVIGLVNGMIGGLILLLPVLALNAGYILTFIVILLTGIFSLYSCYLCVIHMGDQADLDYAILRHFNGNRSVKVFYDLCVWSNLILIDMLYFELIMMQWDGLVTEQKYPIFNPIINALVLFALVFILKYVELGASVMAYGIISIASYLFFLIWVVATSDQGNTSQEFQAFGSGSINMAAAMGQAFSIQSFFIPVLKKSPNPSKHILYTSLAYLVGGLAYFYIAYMGAFGILHRYLAPDADTSDQVTIQSYFGQSAWEIKIIESIYLVHLYSVFPQFMIIGKKRLFSVFGWPQSHMGSINIAQIIYFSSAIGICFLMGIQNISITDIIDINGAVIGFFFIYFMPALLHIKCMYFSKGKLPLSQKEPRITVTEERQRKENEIQMPGNGNKFGDSKLDDPLLQNGKKKQEDQPKGMIQLSDEEIQNSFYYCDCGKDPSWKKKQALDIALIVIMVLMGAFIMVNGIYTVAT